MRYKKGFNIKPQDVRPNGMVIFTDGTNDVSPNQVACEAYGFNYRGGVCYATNGTTSLQMKFDNEKVLINGDANKTSMSRGSFINGTKNEISSNRNCIVSGQENTVELGINNSSVIGGKLGKASHTGEIVLGGGNGDGSLVGQNQMSVISLSGRSSGAEVTLFIQGDSTSEEQITLPTNSITIYEVFISGICHGGDSGTVGHYKCEHHTGSILSDDDGVLTKVAYATEAISSSGTTGTISLDVGTDNIFSIEVSGESEVNAYWYAVVKLYINKTIEEV